MIPGLHLLRSLQSQLWQAITGYLLMQIPQVTTVCRLCSIKGGDSLTSNLYRLTKHKTSLSPAKGGLWRFPFQNSIHRVASSWRIQKSLLYRRIQDRERTRIWRNLWRWSLEEQCWLSAPLSWHWSCPQPLPLPAQALMTYRSLRTATRVRYISCGAWDYARRGERMLLPGCAGYDQSMGCHALLRLPPACERLSFKKRVSSI